MQSSDNIVHPATAPLEYPSGENQALFEFIDAQLIEKTAIATIWKATLASGDIAALKTYHHGDMRGEATGYEFLQACHGVAAAQVIKLAPGTALIEWLDGPSLGDLTRQGDDQLSAEHLARVASRLHAEGAKAIPDLPMVSDWLNSLFKLKVATNCPSGVVADLGLCMVWARELLDKQGQLIALHGDLHHDNVRLGERGYCAFDAKGVMGERAYELANAFRNPKGAFDIVNNLVRIEMLADIFSQGFQVERGRLLKWAAVKCALSIAWRAGDVLEGDAEFALLAKLITAAK